MMKRSKASKYLKTPTYPIQIDRDRSVAGLLAKMEATGFQGRNLAAAHQVWLNMLQDNSTVFLGLSGSLVSAGMRRLIAYLIKNHYVDVLVATGANLFHDLHETLLGELEDRQEGHHHADAAFLDIEQALEGVEGTVGGYRASRDKLTGGVGKLAVDLDHATGRAGDRAGRLSARVHREHREPDPRQRAW